jgi:hypothetical protein
VPVLDIVMLNVFGNLFGHIFLPEWMAGNGLVTPQITADPSTSLGASNSNTGPGSSNTADASLTNNLDVTATDNATTSNALDIKANTGGNTVAGNTTAGNLTAGDVNVQLTLTDIIRQITGDSWFLIFVNVLGQWTGQILGINPAGGSVIVLTPSLSASNSNTGPYSTNTATATAENNLTLDHNSDAAINNSLTLDLNTGHNTVAYNTTAGNLTTGNINVLGSIVNIINQAINLNQRLFLGFINILGDWFGSLGPKSAFPAPEDDINNTSPGQTENSSLTAPVAVTDSLENGGASEEGAQVGDTSSSGTTTQNLRRASPTSLNKPEAAQSESIALSVQDGAFSMSAAPEAAQSASRSSLTWKLVPLGLLVLGLILLLSDLVSRRRQVTLK